MKQLLITFAALVLVGCGPSMSIYEAAKGGNIEAVMKAIEFGPDINDVDNAGETALEIATIEGHIDIIVLLIDKGADVNFKNSCGFTTLHTAAFFRHKELVEIFI